jgi:serine/threonine protein kinase
MTDVSKATTLPMSAASRATRGKALLLPQQVVTSPETKLQYRIDSLLGQGGFGQAYLATRLTRSREVPRVVAVKASEHIDGWVREAYFGRILEGNARAIRVYDAFPLAREDGSILYLLALEWARHGDLRSFLERTRKGWAEKTARREIAGILQVLGSLHRGQMLHRDLTPMNVFVCEDGTASGRALSTRGASRARSGTPPRRSGRRATTSTRSASSSECSSREQQRRGSRPARCAASAARIT